MNKFTAPLLVLSFVVGIAACSDSGTEPQTQTQDSADTGSAKSTAPEPAAAPPAQTAAAPAADPHAGLMRPAANAVAASNSGRVLDAVQTSSYSYLLVEDGGRQVWLASSRIEVAPGMNVSWGDYAVMRNFHSKALNRTFNEILFVSAAVPGPAADQGANPGAGGGSSGQVIAVNNGGGYSYVQVKTDSGEQWLAAPMLSVQAGDRVNWQGGAVMRNFDSKALNRSFDEIMFVGGLNVSR